MSNQDSHRQDAARIQELVAANLQQPIQDLLLKTKEAEDLKKQIFGFTTDIANQKKEMADLQVKLVEAIGKGTESTLKQKEAIEELKIYQWAGRFILTGLLLFLALLIWQQGKLADFLKGFVDQRLQEKGTLLDKLGLVSANANSGAWVSALEQIREPWAQLKDSKPPTSIAYTKWVYQMVLWILANVEKIEPNGEFLGADVWKETQTRPDFRALIGSAEWAADDAINLNMALCTLKYEDTDEARTTARGYLKRCLSNPDVPEQQKAPRHFNLAMIDLVEGHMDDAVGRMIKAEELDPSTFLLEDRFKYKNSFVNSTEFLIWRKLAKKRDNTSFDTSYDALLDRLSKVLEERKTGK